VKGLGLRHPDAVELTAAGVVENRRFHLASNGRLYNGKNHGPLVQVSPELEDGRLSLRFPGGEVVAGDVELGRRVETIFYTRPVAGRVVVGPWAEALSSFVGEELELVHSEEPGTGVDVRVGTLVGRASCRRLGEELGAEVDPRRFRMLLEVEGPGPHEEDTWDGRLARVGGASVRIAGPVPRCAVTTQDPGTGLVTLATLRAIKDYRGLRDGKEIDFGVYFDVEEPGRVRVGDAVEPI
jgi:uncharacterized protein